MRFEAQIPAQYNGEDELDIDGVKALINDLHTDWYMEDAGGQRQAIANALRVALISPRQSLKWNSVVYQDLMHVAPEASDPNLFQQIISDRKNQWDSFGQQTLDIVNENSEDQGLIDYGPGMLEKYQPGIWTNIRNCANVGPYIDQLRQIALYDLQQGGDGRYWREGILDLGIPGVGPKVASFAWLLLAPKTSKLATIDVHMMRALGKKDESPATYADYLNFEKELDDNRKAMGYGDDVSLGSYQWALWDKWRTPGYHQSHSSLRPQNPVDWRNVDWAPQPLNSVKQAPGIPEDQMALPVSSGWKRDSGWSVIP